MKGVASALFAAVSAGAAYTCVRGLKRLEASLIVCYFMITSTLVPLFLAAVTGVVSTPHTTGGWAAIAGTGICGLFGQLTMTWGMQVRLRCSGVCEL